jgi:hypothetical protein
LFSHDRDLAAIADRVVTLASPGPRGRPGIHRRTDLQQNGREVNTMLRIKPTMHDRKHRHDDRSWDRHSWRDHSRRHHSWEHHSW